MRAPLPMARTMPRTAAVCVAVACRGGADARESKNAAGADAIGPGRAPGRAAWPALAVAVPADPAIAAATRLMPAGTTNRRLRMLPPRVEGMPPPSGNPRRVEFRLPYDAITRPFVPHYWPGVFQWHAERPGCRR